MLLFTEQLSLNIISIGINSGNLFFQVSIKIVYDKIDEASNALKMSDYKIKKFLDPVNKKEPAILTNVTPMELF